MSRLPRIHAPLLIAAALALLTFASPTRVTAQATGDDVLFTSLRVDAPDPGVRAPGVLVARAARTEVGKLNARTTPGATIGLPLGLGTVHTAVFDDYSSDPFNGRVWTGTLAGIEHSSVILVVDEGLLGGTISLPGRQFGIQPLRRGRVRIVEYDPAAKPRADDAIIPPPSRSPGPARPALRPGPATIDVLALYIPAALAELGGRRKMKMAWKVAIAAWNQALSNSKVRMSVRLMKVKKIPYSKPIDTDPQLINALRELQTQGDGQLEKAHRLRRRFGADFVSISSTFVPGICGRGYKPGTGAGIQPVHSIWAFSIIRSDCVGGFDALTVAHEGGHNMGLNHDRANARTSAVSGAYSYSFGYRIPGRFSTVMSYFCIPDDLERCPSIPNFSNPKVREDGKRTGVRFRRKKAADNARSLNLDRAVFESFTACKKQCG